MYKKISKHVFQRYKDRGLKIEKLYNDLSLRNLKTLITRPDGTKIVFTKNKLKFVIKNEIVITVMKIRSQDIKREMKKYGYL